MTGWTPNVRNRTKDFLQEPSRSASVLPENVSGRLVLVYAYYPESQTVDVVPKLDPKAAIIKGVAIANSDKSVLHTGRAFRSVSVHGEANATVGYVIYPGEDASGGLLERLRRFRYSRVRHPSQAPYFTATFRVEEDAVPETYSASDTAGTNPDVVGPNDEWLISRWGQKIVFKANGDLVLRVPGILYGYGTTQTASANAKEAARKGDAASTTITGGSTKVKWG